MKNFLFKIMLKILLIKRNIFYVIALCRLKFYKKNVLKINYKVAENFLNDKRCLLSFKDNYNMSSDRDIMLSIIIPIYNSEDFIKSCLDSIVMQKIKYTYEVICINDGSTDNSLKILKNYQQLRLKIISQENAGVAVARNKGLEKSKGKYIFFIDSDDILLPGALNIMMENALNTEADIVLGRTARMTSNGENILYFNSNKVKNKIDATLLESCNYEGGTPWGKLYKWELWKNVKFLDGYAFEDIVIFLLIYPLSHRINLVEEFVYCARSIETSLYKRQINSNKNIDALWGVIKVLEKIKKDRDKINIIFNDEYVQLLLFHLSKVLYLRLKKSEDILKNAFIISGNIINLNNEIDNKKIVFKGKNKNIYRLLLYSFEKKDFGLWKQCCKVLVYSGEI